MTIQFWSSNVSKWLFFWGRYFPLGGEFHTCNISFYILCIRVVIQYSRTIVAITPEYCTQCRKKIHSYRKLAGHSFATLTIVRLSTPLYSQTATLQIRRTSMERVRLMPRVGRRYAVTPRSRTRITAACCLTISL